MEIFTVQTTAQQMLPITQQVQRALQNSGLTQGICQVYCPHTTAAITINENADPDVCRDLLLGLEQNFPQLAAYRHFEGNSPAHLKAMLVGESVSIPFFEGKLCLGRWQGIYFCEFDGPRTRQFYVTLLA